MSSDAAAMDVTGDGDSDDEAEVAMQMLGKTDLGDKIKEGWLKKVSSSYSNASFFSLLFSRYV